MNLPDALAATPLAKKYNAPIILTDGKKLNKEALNELKRLKVKKVFMVGGEDVLSTNIYKEIQALGITVQRISGANRYETSIKVANHIGTSNGIFVVTGLNYADALTVGPIEANNQMPILLVNKGNTLTKELSNFIKTNNISKSYIIGGNAAISDSIKSNFKNSIRISGVNRYETNKKLLNYFKNNIDFSKAYIATGIDFPDALAGGALASLNKNPIILTSKNPDVNTKNIITENKIDNVTVLGGEAVVPTSTINLLLNATSLKVQITNVDLANELVTIKNNESSDISMTGWKLVSVEGNQEYEFPSGYILKAGATITIASGNAEGTLKWTTTNIWNNSGDKAKLYDSNNNLISEK